MWTYLVCLGFGVMVDPARIGIAAILTSRRRALRTLVAYWVGGIIAGISVGIAVLVLLHNIALVAFETAASTINEVRSAVIILTGGRLQVTLGVIALVCLATMVARERARVTAPMPVAVGGGDTLEALAQPGKPSLLSRLSARTQVMLEGGFVWPAFLAGLGASVPPVEGPMALTVIMASRSATSTQLSAFIVFILLVLVFVEIPLVCYLVVPEKTDAVVQRLNTWIRAHRRQIIQTLLAVTGVVLLVQGVGSL